MSDVKGLSATYSPEDNKLRLYSLHRLPQELYLQVKAAGFKWAPKQELFVAPMWTPSREDFLLELVDEIGDEDYSPVERAADRADRFSGYRDKRASEAGQSADTFDAGPAVHGYQSLVRAERMARKHDRSRTYAVSQWSKAEYWQQRTAGVIAHALYKAKPAVRRSRVIQLETQLRRQTPGGRWANHYALRLAYERAMLENEGGSASALEMEPGGHIGKYQIVRVHKSPTTGAVVSVTVYTPDFETWGGRKRDTQKLNIQRLGESAYTPPTDEDRAAIARVKAGLTAKTQEANKGKPKLINPTMEAARALQDHLNAKATARATKSGVTAPEPSQVLELTQAGYSARSKGSYSHYETYYLRAGGMLDRCDRNMYCGDIDKRPIVCKIRACYGNGFNTAKHIIVITDKPQAALPDWSTVTMPTNAEALV